MKKVVNVFFIFIGITFGSFGFVFSKNKEKPTDLANPLIDTHKSRFDYFVSATVPFGMVALSPDTKHGDLWNSGYLYDNPYILNFSHIHNAQTAGIPIMPVTGPCKGNMGLEANKSKFSHNNETVKLGYHKVFLETYGIMAELTATCRVGMHRYTFPKADEAHILFDLTASLGPTKMSYAWINKTKKFEIEGYSVMEPTGRRKKPFIVYFVVQFDKPFDTFSGWNNGKMIDDFHSNLIEGESCGAFLTYKNLKEGEQIMVKVAVSYVSIQQARNNLKNELNHWNFEEVVKAAENEWNDYLGRIVVEGGTREQRVKFYTDLMHTASKRIASDYNGAYIDWTGPYHIVRQLPTDKDGKPLRPFLDGDGLWGTQWNLNILWSLVYPEYGNWMAETFLDYYRNAGTMSRCSWGSNFTYVMVGDHASPLLSALMSTRRATFDKELAYSASYKNAFPGGIRNRAGYETGSKPSGGGIDWYIDLGYVPVEINKRGGGMHRGGTAMTLEYAYQDWCLASMAKQMNKEEDYRVFLKRSENWRNVFDSSIGWSRPRHESGEWMEGFSPISVSNKFSSPGYIEGNSATYSYYVPQNLEGLIHEMGGNDSFIDKLESSFLKAKEYKFITPHGQHAIGWVDYENQPSCAMAHLFNHAGAPWKSQYWVRQVKEITFGGTDPYSGYNGDEDQGQLGALGVLMAIGLFDVQGCVGETPDLEITSPLFDRTIMKIPSLNDPQKSERFEIVVKRNTLDAIYIQGAQLNGKKWTSFKFPISEFLRGGKLEIELGPEPNKNWGIFLD